MQIHLANSNAGTTGNYFALYDISVQRDVRMTDFKISVKQPHEYFITSTHIGVLDISTIGSTTAHVFPTLVDSLISISILVQLGLTALNTDDYIIIFKATEKYYKAIAFFQLVFGCWTCPCLSKLTPHTAPAIRVQTHTDIVAFWHDCFGSPSLSTLINAEILSVTTTMIRKHTPNLLATSFGHLNKA